MISSGADNIDTPLLFRPQRRSLDLGEPHFLARLSERPILAFNLGDQTLTGFFNRVIFTLRGTARLRRFRRERPQRGLRSVQVEHGRGRAFDPVELFDRVRAGAIDRAIQPRQRFERTAGIDIEPDAKRRTFEIVHDRGSKKKRAARSDSPYCGYNLR
ncbi:hypothetical protein [Sphingomonas sp. 2378]|uniref:hypothetical protein n=1 Tax=Sphingomonas sp. 2378 TaxID=1219748 RepID=UPI00311AE389